MYQTWHTFASNALAAGESPSWVAAMLGHASPEMLFSVYARYIPNRARRDGSALLQRMVGTETVTQAAAEGAAVLPNTPGEIHLHRVHSLLCPLSDSWCRRGDSNPHTLAGT